MHNPTNKIVVIGLEMWGLIENIDDYKPLYRADDKKDADNYVKEISSNIQNEPTMVNKHEFIDKVRNWLEKCTYDDKYWTPDGDDLFLNNLIDDICKYLEE